MRENTPDQKPIKVIQASDGLPSLNLGVLWQYRDLLFLFCWRDVMVRYKQSIIGIGWAALVPVASMCVFTLIFGQLAKLPSDGLPYPIFVFVGLLPWQFFARAISEISGSIVSNKALITKVSFPRLIIPVASALPGLFDFIIGFCVLILLLVYYGIMPKFVGILLPLLVIFIILTALSVGLWLVVLNVFYRDVSHIVPFMVQLWFFLTPVVYPSSELSDNWRMVLSVNPMTSVIEGFRWLLLNGPTPSLEGVCVSFIAMLVMLISGLYVFRTFELKLVDRI